MTVSKSVGGRSQNFPITLQKISRYAHFSGNELRYGAFCERWIASGECISLNNGQYLLVDFDDEADGVNLITAVECMFNCGYRPILARVERYERLHRDMREVEYMKNKGVVIQIDAMLIFGMFGKAAKTLHTPA